MQHHNFHVVRQDILGNPHVAEGVDHANEQILLLGIGEEFDVSMTAMVADHGEAGCGVFSAVVVQNLGKAPVHLVGVSQLSCESAADLRGYQQSLSRDEMFMGCVIFNGCQPTEKSHSLKSFQTYRGVGDFFLESRSSKNRLRSLAPFQRVGFEGKAILLESPQFGPGYACTALQLRQIDLFQREIIPLLGLHFLYGL